MPDIVNSSIPYPTKTMRPSINPTPPKNNVGKMMRMIETESMRMMRGFESHHRLAASKSGGLGNIIVSRGAMNVAAGAGSYEAGAGSYEAGAGSYASVLRIIGPGLVSVMGTRAVFIVGAGGAGGVFVGMPTGLDGAIRVGALLL